MRQIILDTETTGLDPNQGHRIIEFAGLEMVNRKLTGRYLHLYMHPERDIDPDAERVHGIPLEFLADKPKFRDVAAELCDFIADAELIIHNAPFDVGFLNKELELIGRPPLKTLVAKVTDSLVLAKEMFPGKRNSLDALCDRLEVDNSGRTFHGALLDAELLADVYINLTRGQNSLVMDMDAQEGAVSTFRRVDLSAFELPVLRANASEISAHEALLEGLDKASKGKTVWKKIEAATS